MTDTGELRKEGLAAIGKDLRIGYYCIEAADEIDRLRVQLDAEIRSHNQTLQQLRNRPLRKLAE